MQGLIAKLNKGKADKEIDFWVLPVRFESEYMFFWKLQHGGQKTFRKYIKRC